MRMDDHGPYGRDRGSSKEGMKITWHTTFVMIMCLNGPSTMVDRT